MTAGTAFLTTVASIVTPKGSEADRIAGAWWLMFGLAAIVYVVVAGLIVYATVRGRRRGARPSGLREDAFIWIGGVAAPVVILFVLAVVTVHTTEALRRPARGALAVDVAGEDWWWAVRYPGTDIVTANEIHLPVDRPVDLRLTSDNVIHSFWVPELAGKQDAIPGQPNHLRFTPEATGTFIGRCAEYCGLQHAHMEIRVIVQTATDFGRWQAVAWVILFVVQGLEPRRAEDRLAQPLEAEDQEQRADPQLQRRARQPVDERVSGDGGECGQRHERHSGAGQRRAPAARHAHGQDDRQCFDELDERCREHRRQQAPRCA